jgi:glycosyltransferase involved in cell wall biosynthesis
MISVVITTKDRFEFLIRAVTSVLLSKHEVDEIIIINDGGGIICKDMFPPNQISNFVIVNNKESIGGNAARNQGVNLTVGEFLFFLDDDDSFCESNIASKMKVFNSDNDCGLVYTGCKIVKSNALDEVIRMSYPNKVFGNVFKILLEKGNVVGSTSCVAVRRTVFFEAGQFDENLKALQDYDLWLRISRISSLCSDNDCNVVYTIHEDKKQISGDYIKYLTAGNYLLNKYSIEISKLELKRKFLSRRYLRVAMCAAHTSYFTSCKYALKSLLNKLSIKALFLILPYRIQKLFREYA